jgi:hypothetical protein
MIDYKIVNDQVVLSNFDAAFVDGDEATIQRIRQKFLLWKGEWFLNTDAGIPWLQVLGEKPEPSFLSSLFRSVVSEDPGVDEILDFNFSYAGSSRKLRITWRAKLNGGLVAEEEVEVP